MQLVLMGLPGAGKGTQGELLSEQLDVPHVSTGAMFRAAIRSGGPLGAKAKEYIDRGELVPDDISIEIVKERLRQDDCARGFILDGFPRTVPQAIALDRALPELGKALDAAVNIEISEEEAVRRISERVICSQCGATYNRAHHPELDGRCAECGGPLVQRPDDTVETALHRLKVFMDQTHPVLTYYAEQGILVSVDGERPIDQVFQDIVAQLEKIREAQRRGEAAR